MLKKYKLLFISLLVILILISIFFDFISIKRNTYETDSVRIEISVTKFLFFAHVNAKLTNLSDRTIAYISGNSCDDNPLKVDGNIAFLTTYKSMSKKVISCSNLKSYKNLEPNNSYHNSQNYFKVGFSHEPIIIESFFNEKGLSNTKEKELKIKSSVSFLQ